MNYYEQMEKSIIDEKPYRIWKHIVFMIPELLGSVVKIILVILFFQLALATVMATAISTVLNDSNVPVLEKTFYAAYFPYK